MPRLASAVTCRLSGRSGHGPACKTGWVGRKTERSGKSTWEGIHVSREPKVRDLSRQTPSADQLTATEDAFRQGTSLACAILGSALLEHELEHDLRRLFKNNDDETWRRLTTEDGPLGTFSAKIVAGRAFGLYDETVFKNLNLVRGIRNAFAHSKRMLTFEEPAIRQQLRRISLPEEKYSLSYKYLSLSLSESDARNAFILLCDGIQFVLAKHSKRGGRVGSGRNPLGS